MITSPERGHDDRPAAREAPNCNPRFCPISFQWNTACRVICAPHWCSGFGFPHFVCRPGRRSSLADLRQCHPNDTDHLRTPLHVTGRHRSAGLRSRCFLLWLTADHTCRTLDCRHRRSELCSRWHLLAPQLVATPQVPSVINTQHVAQRPAPDIPEKHSGPHVVLSLSESGLWRRIGQLRPSSHSRATMLATDVRAYSCSGAPNGLPCLENQVGSAPLPCRRSY
jgi:hypothetical protein